MTRAGLLILFAFLMSPRTSAATIVNYTSAADWETDVGTFAVESFGVSETGDMQVLVFPDSGIVSTYVPGIGPFVDQIHHIGTLPTCVSGACFVTFVNDGPSSVAGPAIWDLGGSLDAFGLHLEGVTSGLDVQLYQGGGGGSLVATIDIDDLLPGSVGFYGLVSTEPFDTIVWTQIGLGAESFVADDFRFRRSVPTPEPATLGLLALGLALGLGIVGTSRARQRD